MARQYLSRRIDIIDRNELSTWEAERNRDTTKIRWYFQTGDAREKLISLYLSSDFICYLIIIEATDKLNINDTAC